jgi:hypothetical protein
MRRDPPLPSPDYQMRRGCIFKSICLRGSLDRHGRLIRCHPLPPDREGRNRIRARLLAWGAPQHRDPQRAEPR